MLVMQRSHHEWTRRILTRVSRLSEKFTGPVNTSPFYSSSCNKHSFQIGGTMSSPTTSPTLAQLVCGLDTKTHKPRPFTASAQSASTPHNQPVNLESSETLLAHERSFFCFEHPEARRHHEAARPHGARPWASKHVLLSRGTTASQRSRAHPCHPALRAPITFRYFPLLSTSQTTSIKGYVFTCTTHPLASMQNLNPKP
jgi:hypothetical protein